MSNGIESETLHQDTMEEEKDQEMQLLQDELDSLKLKLLTENTKQEDLNKQLSRLNDENKALKEKNENLSMINSNYEDQIVRLNEEIAKHMKEDEQNPAESQYVDEQNDPVDPDSSSNAVTEMFRRKIEEVTFLPFLHP